MTSLPTTLRHSSRFLRQLLLFTWLGSTLLVGTALTLVNIRDHQESIVREAALAAHLVASTLRTPLSDPQRQQLMQAYGQTSRIHSMDGMNVLLVIDHSGRIVFTSRPTWRMLSIEDPLFDRMEGDDPDFRTVVDCFRRNRSDCMELRSEDWHLHLGGFTVVRNVSIPATDLGLPRQTFLVLVNLDAGMLISDVIQDLPGIALLAVVISGLLCSGLWFSLSTRLLPQLLEASQTDTLTQLMSRTAFMELAMDQLAEAEERKGDLIFAILDLDHFKSINDTYGHGCGDAALASVGSLLLTVTRPEDLVCRFGGEEFAMLLSTPRATGNKVLERLRMQLEMNHLHYLGHRIPLSASIGAAASAECGYNLDFLYNAADKALYTAKRGGRNRIAWNSGELVSRLPLSATGNR